MPIYNFDNKNNNNIEFVYRVLQIPSLFLHFMSVVNAVLMLINIFLMHDLYFTPPTDCFPYLRYVCGHGGNITLEKQWTLAPIPYAYQVTLKVCKRH